MRTFILLSLISINTFASDLSSYEEYKNNFSLLTSDIQRVESSAQINDNPIYKEMLQDMNTFKAHYDHFATPLKLSDFYQDTVDNGWANLQRMSSELMSVCESVESRNSALCKNGLERMKVFIMSSQLSVSTKESLVAFIDDYLLQMNAFDTINGEFITRFNSNVEKLNIKDVTPPIVAVKQSVQPLPLLVESPSRAPATDLIANDILASKNLYLAFMSLVGIVMFGVGQYKKTQKKKVISSFYGKLFKLAKKNQIQLKVFGNLQPSESLLVSKFQEPLLNSVALSRSVSNKAHVKFKNKKHELSVEVNFITSRSIQSVIAIPKEASLGQNLETLQQQVETVGGEFSFSNRFNSLGELVQSSVLLEFPKG